MSYVHDNILIVFEDDSWALEVKLCDNREIKEASKKFVNLSNDIDITRHPKPAFLMIITATKTAYKDENGVYIVLLACLRN